MLERIALLAIRRRRLVLAVTALLVVLAGTFGSGVFPRLASEGFVPSDSESELAEQIIERDFDISPPGFLVLVDAGNASVDDQGVAEAGRELTARLQGEANVSNVASYWTSDQSAGLRSLDGKKALVVAQLEMPDEDAKPLIEKYSADLPNAEVMVGGVAAISNAINDQVSEDLAKAESIALPIVVLLLVFVFGGVVAAGVPVLVGLLSIVGALLALFGFSLFTDVSIFSINLVTMLGLGLGIDYSLFVVSRYREELKKGLDRDAAIVRAITTAGRTVMFSSIAIGVSLAALLVFPIYFLRSFAYAGVSVVAIAALSSVVFLPALLAVLGSRIDKWQVIKHRSAEDPSPFWARVARIVIRRPIMIGVATTAALLLLALPFLNVKWGAIDDRVLPSNAPSHLVADTLRTEFPNQDQSTLTVVSPDANTDPTSFENYAARISAVENVARVDSPQASYQGGNRTLESTTHPAFATDSGYALRVVLSVESASTAGTNAAEAVRDVDAPFETLTTGFAASQLDSNEPIRDNLPLAALLLVVASFVILFMMTGSVILPIKAILMAALSLTAALGAVVYIFQYGNFSDFLQFTPTGTIDHTNVLVMFCIAFGLSMDYEVFLLSRIKEEHDLSGNTHQAIERGLERTGRLVTAAALLISVVFLAFATSGIAFIKLIGIGLTISILVDATIVRGLLVPAIMGVMGEANWWAPKRLRRFHNRFGISE